MTLLSATAVPISTRILSTLPFVHCEALPINRQDARGEGEEPGSAGRGPGKQSPAQQARALRTVAMGVQMLLRRTSLPLDVSRYFHAQLVVEFPLFSHFRYEIKLTRNFLPEVGTESH